MGRMTAFVVNVSGSQGITSPSPSFGNAQPERRKGQADFQDGTGPGIKHAKPTIQTSIEFHLDNLYSSFG